MPPATCPRQCRRRLIRAAACVLLLVWMPAGVALADEVIDRVLAVVAGDVIMLSDVRAARDLGLVPSDGAVDPIRTTLAKLIDKALMLDEVYRYAPPEPASADVDLAVAEVRARFASQQALNTALARVGLDDRRLRETLRQDLRIRAYLEQRFTGDTPEHTQTAIDEWMAGLRRRADIVDLYEGDGR